MIDYVTLLLFNMISALVVLAFFLWSGLARPGREHWAPVFGICGLVATVAGFAITFTWPIPAPYSEVYGEMSVLLGALFLGAAWTLVRGGSLLPLGIYAFFAGAAGVVAGIRIIQLSLTQTPILAGIGFILTGLGGVGAGITLWRPDRRKLRTIGGVLMLVAAGIWIAVGYTGYWHHMKVKKSSDAATFRTETSASRPVPAAGKQAKDIYLIG